MTALPANHTRRSRSLPLKMLLNGDLHLLPVYALLRLSNLAREGIDHSGSHHFADHIYRARPSGRLLIGRWLDAWLLRRPETRAFRQRYQRAQTEILSALRDLESMPGPLKVLEIPCGLPRAMAELPQLPPGISGRLQYTGMDINPDVLAEARSFFAMGAFHQGDALRRDQYPPGQFHVIFSMGLGEFLDDAQLASFYAHCHAALLPGGLFYTSATTRPGRTANFMEKIELHCHYRSSSHLQRLLSALSWRCLSMVEDDTVFQAFVTATR